MMPLSQHSMQLGDGPQRVACGLTVGLAHGGATEGLRRPGRGCSGGCVLCLLLGSVHLRGQGLLPSLGVFDLQSGLGAVRRQPLGHCG